MDALARIFIGIRIPSAFRDKIAATQTEIRRKSVSEIRWNSQEELLLTLCNPGEVGMASMNRLVVAVREACQGAPAMQITLEGLVGQPNNLQPRYISLGVGGDVEKLTALQASIARAVTSATGHADNKPFQPHVVLGRLKKESEQLRTGLGRAVKMVKDVNIGQINIDAIEVLRSSATGVGISYVTVEKVPLGSNVAPQSTLR